MTEINIDAREAIDKLKKFVLKKILEFIPNVISIHLGGSSSRKEETNIIYNNKVILLGNLAFLIFTRNTVRGYMGSLKVQKYLCSISQKITSNDLRINHPLVLVKPFELGVLTEKKLNLISPDISIHEIATNDSLIFGKDMRPYLPTEIPEWSAIKIILNRLVGLNLCLKSLINNAGADELTRYIINYESTKGVLAVLEALLVLEGMYKGTYKERIAFWSALSSKNPNLHDEFPTLDNCIRIAALIRSRPNSDVNAYSFWFESRNLLLSALNYLKKLDSYHQLTGSLKLNSPTIYNLVNLILHKKITIENIRLSIKKTEIYYSLMLQTISVVRPDLSLDEKLFEKLLQLARSYRVLSSSKGDVSSYLELCSKVNLGCTRYQLEWLTDKMQTIK